MNIALRTASWSVAAALLLIGATAAQKDRIVLTDGTVVDNVTVTGFDLRNVEYRRRGSSDSKSTDRVADLRVSKVRDYYKRAYAAMGTGEGYNTFLQQARSSKDAFIKQFGLHEAAGMLMENGEFGDAFRVLEELATECPDSGFLPVLYQAKLDYYLSQGSEKAGDAMTVAKRYLTAAQTQGFPSGFAVEAKFYGAMAEAASGGLTGDRLRSQLRALLGESARYPNTANRCRVQIAHTLRAEGKLDDAQNEYEDLLDRDVISETVRGEAWLGLGNCYFAKGSASSREIYRDALLAFLRVYVETPNAAPLTIAEALYMGKQSAEKWGGDDAGRMARALGYRLTRDYPDNPWTGR